MCPRVVTPVFSLRDGNFNMISLKCSSCDVTLLHLEHVTVYVVFPELKKSQNVCIDICSSLL